MVLTSESAIFVRPMKRFPSTWDEQMSGITKKNARIISFIILL